MTSVKVNNNDNCQNDNGEQDHTSLFPVGKQLMKKTTVSNMAITKTPAELCMNSGMRLVEMRLSAKGIRLGILALLLVTTQLLFGVTNCTLTSANQLCVNDVDGSTQTNRPVTMGRVFSRGEITNYPQPVVGGTPLTNYQSDVKNRWDDGSVKFAVISFLQTITANTGTKVTFQNSANYATGCSGGTACSVLTQAQMTGFNSSGWGDAQIKVTALGGSIVTTSALTMLGQTDPASNTYNDCKNDYWLKGPVVTAVIVQDCTISFTNEFGWHWNGTTMAIDAGTAKNANSNITTSKYASLHPWFILYFYPTSNQVAVEAILENDWSGRRQNQDIALEFLGGTGPTSIYSKSTFSFTTGARARKVFWIKADGSANTTGPGHVRTDHNFPYLQATNMIPSYDTTTAFVSPTSNPATSGCDSCTSWSDWSVTDKGDINGTGGIGGYPQDLDGDSEGAPLQREELQYLYNMNPATSKDGKGCGDANSYCAMAWQELTGESGTIDNTLSAGNVVGGGGVWYMLQNVPFHTRESQTGASGQQSSGNSFYCASFADKDVANNATSCGTASGTLNVATGKALSKYAHSDYNAASFGVSGPYPVAEVGTMDFEGWSAQGGCPHWWDLSYTPYLLTGSPYYLEEEFMSASYCLLGTGPGTSAFDGGTFFGYMNPLGGTVRRTAWTLQAVSRAAAIAPSATDFVGVTNESSYYTSLFNSNLEVLMGILNKTDVSGVAPTTTHPNCDMGTAVGNWNRWDWGRCSIISQCTTSGGGSGAACTVIPTALHEVSQGQCPVGPASGGDVPGDSLEPTVTTGWSTQWMENALGLAAYGARAMGLSNASTVADEMGRQIVERVMDSTFTNKYLLATAFSPVKYNPGSPSSCSGLNFNTDPFVNTYTKWVSGILGTYQAQASWGNTGQGYQPFACFDHGYTIIAKSLAAYAKGYGTTSSSATCPSGVCTGTATWAWFTQGGTTPPPYFHDASWNAIPAQCNVNPLDDEQIKFALIPPTVTNPVTQGITITGGVTLKGGTVIK